MQDTAPPTATLPSVAVVVPAHRDSPALRRCLRALANLDPVPSELVVVVDGADPAVETLAAAVANRVLPIARNGGPAAARNAGAALTAADVLLFLDSDVEAPPDLVGGVQRYLAEHPHVDALMGAYDDAPPEANLLSQYKNLLNHRMHTTARREASTFWGACGAVRRAMFDAVGGFDAAYTRPCIEDIELGYRLRAAGATIHMVPSLQVTHLKRWDARSLVVADVRDRAIPWAELLLRQQRFDDDLNISRIQRLKVALALVIVPGGLLAARRRRAGAVSAGAVIALAVLDAPLIRFFARARGPRFAAGAMAWHWWSYLYSAAGLAVAVGRMLRSRALRRPAGRPAPPARR